MRMRSLVRGAARSLVTMIWLAAAVARGQEPAARQDRVSVQAGGSMGPVGASVQAGWFRRWALPQGEGMLWRDRDAQAGMTLGATPAFAQLGVEASAVPIAFLELRARYDVSGYFGAFATLWRAPSRHAPFGDARLRDAEGKPGMGHRLLLAPALRARVGPLILRNEADLSLIALSRGRGWYREPQDDTLVASRDVILADQIAALVEVGRGRVLAGPSAQITWAARADLTRVRVGGIGVLTLTERLGAFSRPRLFVWAGMATRDRNRGGEPFVVAGLTGDVNLEARPAVSPP
jgi:hypothetical protein